MGPGQRASKVGIVSGSLAALILAVVLATDMVPASGGESDGSWFRGGAGVTRTTDTDAADESPPLHLDVVGAEPTPSTLPPAPPASPATDQPGSGSAAAPDPDAVPSDDDDEAEGEGEDAPTDPATAAPPPADQDGTTPGTSGGGPRRDDTSSLLRGYPGLGHPVTGGGIPGGGSDPDPDERPTLPRAHLSGVEEELVRLTNELRADPAGDLARRKPLPACVDQSFYGITVDPATGRPRPAEVLEVDLVASEALSRPWAAELVRRGVLEHRSSDRAVAIYRDLGVGISAAGENVGWLPDSGDDDSDADVALEHFEGWRESDDSHYCALVSPTFTHIAVGHQRGRDRSWAVQNFYRDR